MIIQKYENAAMSNVLNQSDGILPYIYTSRIAIKPHLWNLLTYYPLL